MSLSFKLAVRLLSLATLFLQVNLVSAGIEITPMAGYRIGGEFNQVDKNAKLKFDETESYGFVIDFDQSKYKQITVLYSRQTTSLRSSDSLETNPLTDVDIEYYHIGGNQIWIRDKMRPFFGATVGATHFNAHGRNSTTKFSFSLGGGVKFFVTERFALMAGVRGYGTFFDGSSSLFCGPNGCLASASGSLLFQFEANAGVTLRF
jgi:opacity protein-like surface antigen